MAHLMDDLVQTGKDALTNYFNVVLPEVDSDGWEADMLQLRLTDFNVPSRTVNTYTFTKRGKTYTRVSGLSNQEKNVSMTVRCDKGWKTYNAVSNWIKKIQDNETMAMAQDDEEEGEGYDITVQAINNLTTEFEPTQEWTLINAIPTSLGGISFSEENGEPLTFTVDFTCQDVNYPEDAE